MTIVSVFTTRVIRQTIRNPWIVWGTLEPLLNVLFFVTINTCNSKLQTLP
jgi:hypothetical protein